MRMIKMMKDHKDIEGQKDNQDNKDIKEQNESLESILPFDPLPFPKIHEPLFIRPAPKWTRGSSTPIYPVGWTTQLKNISQSNWIISPIWEQKYKNIQNHHLVTDFQLT